MLVASDKDSKRVIIGYQPHSKKENMDIPHKVREGVTNSSVVGSNNHYILKKKESVIEIIPKDMSVANVRKAKKSLLIGCQHKIGYSDAVLSILIDMSENDKLNVTFPAGLEVSVLKLASEETPDIGIYYAVKQLHSEWVNQFENNLLEVANIVTYTLEYHNKI